MSDRPYRILIIDDCPEDRESYRRWLGEGCESEYEFVEAGSGAEGVPVFRQGTYDCVLLDYRLPDGDGLEVLEELVATGAGKDGAAAGPPPVAVVILTGQGDEGVAVRAMKRGAQDYLVKNRLTAEALHRAIHAAIEKVKLLRKVESQRVELERLATTDGLTGLYNHRFFMGRLAEEIDRAHRYGQSLSFLLMDIDHFKNINDQFGHLVGDRLLQAIARILKRMRKTDFAGRYGGDEFCVLLTSTEMDGAHIVAERLREVIGATIAPSLELPVPLVTCSIGIAQFSGERDTPEDLLKRADAALYLAKETGRNRVCQST